MSWSNIVKTANNIPAALPQKEETAWEFLLRSVSKQEKKEVPVPVPTPTVYVEMNDIKDDESLPPLLQQTDYLIDITTMITVNNDSSINLSIAVAPIEFVIPNPNLLTINFADPSAPSGRLVIDVDYRQLSRLILDKKDTLDKTTSKLLCKGLQEFLPPVETPDTQSPPATPYVNPATKNLAYISLMDIFFMRARANNELPVFNETYEQKLFSFDNKEQILWKATLTLKFRDNTYSASAGFFYYHSKRGAKEDAYKYLYEQIKTIAESLPIGKNNKIFKEKK